MRVKENFRALSRFNRIGALKIVNANAIAADHFDGNLHLVNIAQNIRLNEFFR
jgi:hypothetical protein